jgi:hypothetical protein
MVTESGHDKTLSGELFRVLQGALHGPGGQDGRAAGNGADTAASRRARTGEAVLRALSAWLQTQTVQRGLVEDGGAELRRMLEEVLAEDPNQTEPRHGAGEATPTLPAGPAHSPATAEPAPAPRTGRSPLLAEKLAARLAAVAAGRASLPQPPGEGAEVSGQSPVCPAVPSTRPTIVEDRYELVTRIHQGHHTSVWRGIDSRGPAGDTAVAIKLIVEQHLEPLGGATLASLMAASTAPGLMTLIASGHQDGWAYQVSEWIDGQTLESLLRPRTDSASLLADVPRWMHQLAHALEALHGAGFVHGDLKPANVMIRRDHMVQLIDFDTVRRAGSTSPSRSLTPAFSSPEQLAGQPADRRDDVYSMAVIAYRLFTGEFPYGDEDRPEGGRPRPLPARPAGLDPGQWRALRLGLADSREQRAGSVLDLVQGLWEAPRSAAGPAAASAAKPVARAAPPPARSAGRHALAGVSLLTVLVAGILVYPPVLGPDHGARVLELRNGLWPRSAGAAGEAESLATHWRGADSAAGVTSADASPPVVDPMPVERWAAEPYAIDASVAGIPVVDLPLPPTSVPSTRVSFVDGMVMVPWNAPAALVQVRRRGPLGNPLVVRFQVEPGLAEPDEDFIVPADNRVRFGEGEDLALVVISLVQRTDSRGTRSLWLSLLGGNIDPDGIPEVQVVLMNGGPQADLP